MARLSLRVSSKPTTACLSLHVRRADCFCLPRVVLIRSDSLSQERLLFKSVAELRHPSSHYVCGGRISHARHQLPMPAQTQKETLCSMTRASPAMSRSAPSVTESSHRSEPTTSSVPGLVRNQLPETPLAAVVNRKTMPAQSEPDRVYRRAKSLEDKP